MRRSLHPLAFALTVACGGGGQVDTSDTDPGESWVLRSHVDEGEVCASGESGGPLTFTVVVEDCMSGSCSRGFEGSCTASFDGAVITLTSDISWEDNVSPDATCTDDCGIPMATCTLEGLPDGTWDVAFGGATLTVTMPSDEAGCAYR